MLVVDEPIVTIPLVDVMLRVPLLPRVMSPLRVTTPVLVEIFPPFQVIPPPTVNEALVADAAARSWLKVNVPEVVNVVGSLKLKLP